MKTLYVIPHAQPSSVVREVDLLIGPDRAAADELLICCLAGEAPACQAWRTAGITLDVLHGRSWLDPRAIWRLAGAVKKFQPDLIQVWGLESLRTVRLASPKSKAAIVVRKPFRSDAKHFMVSSFDRWLLRSVQGLLVANDAEAARCAAAGVAPEKLKIVAPGVAIKQVGPPGDKPLILCAGELLPHKGFLEAIWAFDFLHWPFPAVELAIIGEGPDRRRLEQFTSTRGTPQRIHLPGYSADLSPWLARATLVWVPSLTDGTGVGLALEAMAAGLPVIASRCPALTAVVRHGETGFLVQPGNKLELAQRTRQLLEDRELSRRFGEAGRNLAKRHFTVHSFVEVWSRACAPRAA